MRTVGTIEAVRAHVRAARDAGRTVGLVPTMGAFHGGHEALMQAARAGCDEVVVSLFVNPSQFDDAGDLAAYPRSEDRDAAIATDLGVDLLFAPSEAEIYPDGFATSVSVGGLGTVLEGAARGPGHFAGVCTVVAKLFSIVAPDVAYFGQKDAQQLAVIRRMARDLDLPVWIEAVPTVREPDGLALSSRNVRLGPPERARARGLARSLAAARNAIAAGARDPDTVLAAARAALGLEPEYLALVDPDTFAPVQELNGRVLVAVAARVGPVRLIDNVLIETSDLVATRDRAGVNR
jgi:pantoate--beta-alanine ligase